MSTFESLQTNKEIQQSLKIRLYVFTGISVVVLMFLILFAIKPTLQTIFQVITDINQKKSINLALDNKIAALNQLEKQYYGSQDSENIPYKDTFEDIALVFPEKGDFSYILTLLEAICRRNNFVVSSISFTQGETNSGDPVLQTTILKKWSANLSVQGNKGNMVKLLQDLESMPNYPNVEAISFSSDTLDSGLMSFSIGLSLYKIETPDFYNLDK